MAVCHAQSPGLQTVYIVPGGAVTLTANAINAIRFQWIKDGSPITNATTLNYRANLPGVYTVISYIEGGCSSDVSSPVNVLMSPASKTADMMIGIESENKIITVNEVFDYALKASNNGPDDASSILVTSILSDKLHLIEIIAPLVGVARYDQASHSISWQLSKLATEEVAILKIKVKGTSGGTIKNSATITAAETDPNLSNNIAAHTMSILGIKVPNVFTPNGDSKNDQFVILGLEQYLANEVTIVNRWGSSVYEKKDYKNDWTANGLSDGTYFYIIRVRNNASEWQELKGYVTIIH
jgi:gliding motility-associated-like protein/uncharacterized repeat protein (TIGR01451 family)